MARTPADVQTDIDTIYALLDHHGWTKHIRPRVLEWQAAAMTELLADIGDKKARNDFLRGQITAYKNVLNHFGVYLLGRLQDELAELTGKEPESPTDSATLPKI